MHDYIQFPLVDMREAPSAGSKVVSQALFGECVQVGAAVGDWRSILTPDGYTGWVKAEGIVMRPEPYPRDLETSRLSAHLYPAADTEYGPLMTLPFGSPLQLIDSSDPRWHKVHLPDGREAFIQKGDVVGEPFELISFSRKFLNLPYTWGGRSSFGFDCSGFIQIVYGRLGIPLPRDARQQILDPRAQPIRFEELVLGDLIFWGYSEAEIKHVGMFLEKGQFIHTSVRENRPYLRVSQLVDFEWSGQRGVFYPFRTARRLLPRHSNR